MRRDRALILATGLLALLVRIGFVFATRHGYHLLNDAADYDRLARSLAAGHGWGTSTVAAGGGPTAFRPPGYPLFLAAVYAVAGPHVLAGRLANAVLGAAAASLTAAVAAQVWRRTAVTAVAGALAALYPAMVISGTALMSEALFVVLGLAAVWAALQFRRDGGWPWLVGAGLALGGAILTRPVGLVMIIGLAVVVVPRARRWEPRLLVTGILLGAVALPCAAWEIRDVAVLHDAVPLTTQDGYVVSGTYNATSAADRSQPALWRPANLDPADARLLAAHPHADEVTTSHVLESSAVHYLSHHPGYATTVVVHNILRVFDLTSPSFGRAVTMTQAGVGARAGDLEWPSALAVEILALDGLAVAAVRRQPLAYLLVPLLLVAVTAPLQGVARFRAPIDPFLVVLAAGAVVYGAERLVALRRRTVAAADPALQQA